MDNPSQATQPAHQYVLGHSEHEVERRLKAQARLIDPITERFFLAAGVGSGMRMLDVGSGAGDVFLILYAAFPTFETARVHSAPNCHDQFKNAHVKVPIVKSIVRVSLESRLTH